MKKQLIITSTVGYIVTVEKKGEENLKDRKVRYIRAWGYLLTSSSPDGGGASLDPMLSSWLFASLDPVPEVADPSWQAIKRSFLLSYNQASKMNHSGPMRV